MGKIIDGIKKFWNSLGEDIPDEPVLVDGPEGSIANELYRSAASIDDKVKAYNLNGSQNSKNLREKLQVKSNSKATPVISKKEQAKTTEEKEIGD